MKKFFSIFAFSLVVFTVKIARSQTGTDTILLVNGDEIITNVQDTIKGVITYSDLKIGEKDKSIEVDRVFSIRNKKGETVLYKYDSLAGNDLTIDEMRYYIKGEQDAEKGFKPLGSFWGNMVLGAAAGATGNFLCPLVPFGFTALTNVPKVRIKHSTVSNLEYLKHDTYIMGYEKAARNKKRTKSLIGGGIGLVAGLGVFWGILQPTHNEIIKVN